jgi:hypothetical protein
MSMDAIIIVTFHILTFSSQTSKLIEHGLADISILSESEASMIYFDSDMSKSTNTVVYFDWKMVI